MAVESRTTVQNAGQLFIVSNKDTYITVEGVSRTDIDEVKKYLRIRFNYFSAIPGTHTIHYVEVLD